MTDVAIVTTTINNPTRALEAYAVAGQLVVVGDLKTPPETEDAVHALDGVYLTPDDQREWRCSGTIGWNCIQRRNVGFLRAYQLEADVVITVDDDNVPGDPAAWRDQHLANLDDPVIETLLSSNDWFNPGSLLVPEVQARGFPYERREHAVAYSSVKTATAPVPRVGVNCGLWLGDPDVDALQRIVLAPETRAFHGPDRTVVNRGVWSPINSQNTAWRRELLPLAVLPPKIGRWDDILGGYFAQWAMRNLNFTVAYGQPLVTQERNAHNLWHDLRAEVAGLEYTTTFCDDLARRDPGDSPIEALVELMWYLEDSVSRYPAWPVADVVEFLRCWTADWEGLL